MREVAVADLFEDYLCSSIKWQVRTCVDRGDPSIHRGG